MGWVAERYPALIRRIVGAGHEIASHGYGHDRVFTFTPEQFAADLLRSRKLIEDAGGVGVTGYRAPSFSIDQRTPWAHEILAEQGYTYSSSVAPVKHDHYGWAEALRASPFVRSRAAISSKFRSRRRNWDRKRLAAGGGGFFRLLPYAFSRWAIRQVNDDERRPAVIYFHPWEIDPGQPRVANAPIKSKLRHYTKLDVMADKLRRLPRDFRWDRLDNIVAREKARLAMNAPDACGQRSTVAPRRFARCRMRLQRLDAWVMAHGTADCLSTARNGLRAIEKGTGQEAHCLVAETGR